MVIGGFSQGKRAYAEKLYPNIKWTDGTNCSFEELFFCEGIINFHEYIRRWMKNREGTERAEELAEDMIERNPGLILVCSEIGCGLVPADPFDRMYREETGRICTKLALFSERIDRVVCGIGTRIK